MIEVKNAFEVEELVKVKDGSDIRFRIQEIHTVTCTAGTQVFYNGVVIFAEDTYRSKERFSWIADVSKTIRLHEMMLEKLEGGV